MKYASGTLLPNMPLPSRTQTFRDEGRCDIELVQWMDMEVDIGRYEHGRTICCAHVVGLDAVGKGSLLPEPWRV